MNRWLVRSLCALTVLALLFSGMSLSFRGGPRPAAAQTPLLVDGDFEANTTHPQLRAQEKPQGWYESRRDGKAGPLKLKLSKTKVKENATKKAMIIGDPERNTYLTQAFGQPQKGTFSLKWDIYVKKVLPARNRSAFQMIGSGGGKGPNSTGTQRFVFLAFENSKTPGKLDLFAYEAPSPATAEKRTPVAANLDPQKWYTIKVDVDVAGKAYTVTIPGVTAAPVKVKAFDTGKGAPTELTHISFASWNDGPGTFFVDNVGQP